MQTKEYHFTIQSRGKRWLLMLLLIACGTALTLILGKEMGEASQIFVVAAIALVSVILASWAASAKVTVRLSEKGFEHIWNRRFFLCFKKDRVISWNKIEGMNLHTGGSPARFETPASWYYFILKVKDEKDYRISKSFMGTYDTDFTEFVRNFLNIANEFRKSKYPDLNPIAEI